MYPNFSIGFYTRKYLMSKIEVTVVIPVYNEEKFIDPLFQSLKNQDYEKTKLEIIVVDGASSDQTLEKLEVYKKDFANLKIAHNNKKIVPISMNIGIKEAQGEYIVRLDAHSEYANDYISKCVEYLKKTDADNVGGAIRLLTTNPPQEAIKLATTCPFGIGNSMFHYENYEGYVDTVYLGAYKKTTLEKIGLYDEELVRNQDDELNYRLIKNSGKIYMTPEIKCYYYPRDSLKKLWSQYYQYGYWKVRVIQKHKLPASIRHLVPVTFVLSILISLLISLFSFWGLVLLALVLLPYTTLLSFFTAKVSFENKNSHVFLLALVFVILHTSYGFGFLKGMIDFMFLKKLF